MKRPTRATVALTIAIFNAFAIPITFFVAEAREGRSSERLAETALQNCELNNVQNKISRSVFEKRLKDDPGGPAFAAQLREAVEALAPRDCNTLPALRPEAKKDRRVP